MSQTRRRNVLASRSRAYDDRLNRMVRSVIRTIRFVRAGLGCNVWIFMRHGGDMPSMRVWLGIAGGGGNRPRCCRS